MTNGMLTSRRPILRAKPYVSVQSRKATSDTVGAQCFSKSYVTTVLFLMRDTQIILAIVLLPVPREVEVDVL